MTDSIVQCVSLEDALAYEEWFVRKAAQYGVLVDTQLVIGVKEVYVVIKAC